MWAAQRASDQGFKLGTTLAAVCYLVCHVHGPWRLVTAYRLCAARAGGALRLVSSAKGRRKRGSG